MITHSPEDYSPDLLAVSKLVCNASLLASMFGYKTKEKPMNVAAPIYFMDTFAGIDFAPTDYVDISDAIQTKIDMLWKHESVLKWLLDKKGVDFEDFVRISAHYRGIQCGVAYAEAFHTYHKWMYVRPERLLP